LIAAVHKEFSDVQDHLVIACGCAVERALQAQESTELEELRTEIAELRAELARSAATRELAEDTRRKKASEETALERVVAEADTQRRDSEEEADLAKKRAEQEEEEEAFMWQRAVQESERRKKLAEEVAMKAAEEEAALKMAEEAGGAAKRKAASGMQVQQHSTELSFAEAVGSMAAKELAWKRTPEEAENRVTKGNAEVKAKPVNEVKLSAKELQAMCKPALYDQERGEGRIWIVVGGEDTGGIVVRKGESLGSERYPFRLSRGTTIEELELNGNRMHYKRISGDGPDWGWVNVKHNQKALLELDEEQ